jgi:hypothetical protein
MWSTPTRLALAFWIINSSAQAMDGQQIHALEAGIRNRELAAADSEPSTLSTGAKSVGWATYGSVLGGFSGWVVDNAYCNKHHRDEGDYIFGPCFFYANGGFATGWFGGAMVGATLGAARMAEKRGCPRGAALMRAFAGAALGAAPGLIIVVPRPGKYPPSRSLVILGTPLLAGFGATAAIIGCHTS